MGRNYSKPQFVNPFSLSQCIKEACKDLNLPRSNYQSFKKQIINAFKKEQSSVPLKVSFVPPVTHFVPRSVSIRYKRIGNKVLVEPFMPHESKVRVEEPLGKRFVPKKNRPNKQRRGKIALKKRDKMMDERIRRWRSTNDEPENINTSIMIRKVNILTIAGIVGVVNGMFTSLTLLAETLKSFISWGYYSWNSDDFGTLTRLTHYFNIVRSGDGERLSNVFNKLKSDVTFLFTTFMYVNALKRSHVAVSSYNLTQLVFNFMAHEEVSGLLDDLPPIADTVRSFWDDERMIVDVIISREGLHFENLLYKVVCKEVTVFRGLRFFKSVVRTVEEIPMMRLAFGLSRTPGVGADFGSTLYNLTRPIGTETHIVEDDSYVQFIADMSKLLDFDLLVEKGTRALAKRFRSGSDSTAEEEEPRFKEL